MNQLEKAIQVFCDLDREAEKRRMGGNVLEAARLFVTLVFVAVTVSFHKYDFSGLLGMALFCVVQMIVLDIPLKRCFSAFKVAIWPILLFGIANPIFDRAPYLMIGALPISGGVISMITLFIKGFFSVFAVTSLVLTISMNGVVRGFRTLHFPKILTTTIMLTFRYVIVLLQEVNKMNQAYRLRAPGQKGIHVKAWGSFAGMLLIRSIDRAHVVYHSMLLRGFDGEIKDATVRTKEEKTKRAIYSILYTVLFTAAIILLRIFPLFRIFSGLF